MPVTTLIGTINATPVKIALASDTATSMTIEPVPVEGETTEQFAARSAALYAFLSPKATINAAPTTSGVITYRMFSQDEYNEFHTDAWAIDGVRFFDDVKTLTGFVPTP